MNMIKIILIATVFAASAFAQERYVKPVDEAPKDPSFLAFRTKLIAAAERKDLNYVKSIMDPKITLSFGGHEGVKDFRKLWTREADFWKEFLPVIKNGGSFLPPDAGSGKMFVAPYTYSKWPGELDSFEHSVIFGNNVNLRAEPGMSGRVLEQLSYNIIRPTETKTVGGANWFKVRTLGGKIGWVHSDYIRSPIDYRAGFEKKRGQWKMTFFVAGD